jgi:mRNA-degrading endonuclease YafQ of YafQ-DinJ toxin-antitoxin module
VLGTYVLWQGSRADTYEGVLHDYKKNRQDYHLLWSKGGNAMNQLEIHQTRAFRKQFQSMYRGGKKERTIIERAEAIIRRLQTDALDEKAACKRTHNGELRLRYCRKYNLSCGVRLISLKRDHRLIFTYIGSHDDCQKWIENNRDFQDEIESRPMPLLTCEQQGESLGEATLEELIMDDEQSDEYEEQLMSRLNDHVLREIFVGLCHKAPAECLPT